MTVKERVERRIGWLFGSYSSPRKAITDPWLAVGPCEYGSGIERYQAGAWLKVGGRSWYAVPSDAQKRGRQRLLSRLEQHANREDA